MDRNIKTNIELGAPTDYGFKLPKLRYKLSKSFMKKNLIKLLDFGCGNGANTILFKEDFQQIIGVEVEKDRLKEASDYVNSHGITNISYKIYDGYNLPFKEKTFDYVISYEVLEHTEDDNQAIKEIKRVLKKNGLFILTVPNKGYLMETHGFNFPFKDIIMWHRVPFLSWLPDSIHSKYARARIYSKDKILRKLKDQDFTILHQSYIMPPFDKVKNKHQKKLLTGIFDLLANSPLKGIGVAHFIVAKNA